ncbi:MAG TPA: hypothetical protein VHO48_14005 [Anaerolineaceae bacterium]|nr:hypothetical protein [Anaerolineaceae bacterium]
MATCDVCGKETGSRWDEVPLYRGRLVQRSIASQNVAGSKTVSTFEKIEPVKVIACSRHKKDLWLQRSITGIICFIILFLPAWWLVSRFIPGGTRENYIIQVVLAFIIAIVLTALLTRFVRYDGLIASMMTIEGKKSGSKFEYFNEKKYQRMLASQPKAE